MDELNHGVAAIMICDVQQTQANDVMDLPKQRKMSIHQSQMYFSNFGGHDS
jgi:hypothetical protein